MKPEEYAATLQQALGPNLKSVLLYGSAASVDFIPGRSDYNVLVVVETLELPTLKIIRDASRNWLRAGNPPPLCFTFDRLKNSTDVFPIELLDLKEQHRLLFGLDVFGAVDISPEYLRHQLEYELKSKLIALREGYLVAGGKDEAVRNLMSQSLAGFLVLFRAALRLFGQVPPAGKLDAARKLGEQLGFSAAILDDLDAAKRAERGAGSSAEEMFTRYLKTVETVVDKVDRHLHGTPER